MTTLLELQAKLQTTTNYKELCDLIHEAGKSGITEEQFDEMYDQIMKRINKYCAQELEKAFQSNLIPECSEVPLQTCT